MLVVKKRSLLAGVAVSVISSVSAVGISSVASAQDVDEDVLVVTGALGTARSVDDSAVPIDVIGESEIESVSFADTNDILQRLVPSYALTRQPISDGATFIRPASLRGLPTDKTLVLVNSKRRHRAALVQIGGSGTQGPDIATIPATALKTVEVLRDGAAAQYGTDAVAGVINFILKDNDSGLDMTAQLGQFYEGDGTQLVLGANAGFALGNNGFVSVSAEYVDADATVRAEQYCEPWFCLDPDGDHPLSAIATDPTFLAGVPDANIGDGDVVQPWGTPESEAARLFVNAGYEFANGSELYGFGNYSESTANGSFFYRFPGNSVLQDLREEDGSIYNPIEIYPGGFTPRFFGDVIDYSVLGGYRGELGNGISYDISGRFGHSEIQYTLKNTINPSLGPDTGTSFDPGDLINEELQFQADFGKEFEVGFAGPLTVAFGLSYLDESYEVVEGDPASYEVGPFAVADPFGFCDAGAPTAAGAAVMANGSTLDCADEDDPVYTAVAVGSNGFPGYSPEFSGEFTRDSYAAYVEASADVTDKLFLQAAARVEDYSDFDTEVIGKFAAKYDFTPDFAMRGSVSTGFRAPTPGQQGTTNVSTRLPNGTPVAVGLFPASSTVAQALGATPLEPETSINYTVGFVGDAGPIGFTADFYQIEIDDRTFAISTLDVSSDPTAGDAYQRFLALDAAGVAGAASIGGVNYFTNAFNTKTSGFDVVLTTDADWGSFGSTDFLASINYNKTEFNGGPVDDFLNAESQFDFENGTPEWRGVVSATHSIGDFLITVRNNIYGSYENGNTDVSRIQEFGPEVLVDLDIAYEINDNYSIVIGARNIFDNYPLEADDRIGDTCCGRIYRSDSIVDWQGGFYYARLNASF